MENPALKSLQDQLNQLIKHKLETEAVLSAGDEELKSLAQDDLESVNNQIESIKLAIESIQGNDYGSSKPSSQSAGTLGDCIIEIRAGTGGDEAGLFASALFIMYSKFAEMKKWKVDILSKNEGGIGNIKEISFQITGKNANPTPYQVLEFESGVHRVQRIPVTESGGRIHTSTATVAVLPIVGEKEVEIRPEDLRIDTFRAGGKGGQHVNKTESAIRITHLPTGVVVQCQDERSQFKNKDKAMSMLRSKLFEMMKQQQKNSLDDIRSDQVGTGERSEKIRTYNFPQDRVTDHRIKESWFGMEKILGGEISNIVGDIKTKMTENPDLKSDEV